MIPHILEKSGSISSTAYTFDTTFFVTYAPGLAGIPAGGGAKVDLYLFDASGTPMLSGTGQEVCSPCEYSLDSSRRRLSLRVDDLVNHAGGFGPATDVKLGFGVVVIGGNDPGASMLGFVTNSGSTPQDISVFGFVPEELGSGAQPLQNGACCQTSGSCSSTTQASCDGTFRGVGTTCNPNPCPQPPQNGACCQTSGSCSSTTQASCDGTFRGVGTTCNPNPCPQPTGACCRSCAACAVRTAATCDGTFMGAASSCQPDPCPGLCCGTDGSCSSVPAAQCPTGIKVAGGQCSGRDDDGDRLDDLCDPEPLSCVAKAARYGEGVSVLSSGKSMTLEACGEALNAHMPETPPCHITCGFGLLEPWAISLCGVTVNSWACCLGYYVAVLCPGDPCVCGDPDAVCAAQANPFE